MRSSPILTLSSLLTTSFASVASVARDSDATATTSPAAACQFFKSNYANLTYLPEDTGYSAENEGNWNAGAWLSPACIFAPANEHDLSTAVTKLTELNTLFAMRGGGHMPMAAAANINSSGVLISSSNLNFLQLSDDKQNMSMGPGNRWYDVYTFLNDTDPEITVVGGRLAPVGVPGLLLGGGFSFYSYEYGMSSTNGNILGYQCVLANGTIIEITSSNQYSDLFWALKGGGNSFCLVTRFDMKTISSPITMMAEASYGNATEVKDGWIDSVLNFAHNASVDPRGAITPVARYGPLVGRSYDSTLFYNGNDSTPAVLNDFLGGIITPTNASSIFGGGADSNTALVQMSVADYGALSKTAFEPGGASYGFRQRFHVYPLKATKEAMNIVHDTYFETAEAMLANVTGVFTGLAWNPITESFINATNSGIGSPLNPTEVASFWTEESLTWENAEDDAIIENFLTTVNANITTQLTAINATASFLYLNDADEDQNVFATYPAANLQRLKDIRDKYDPDMVYTNLMPGGFKVASD